mmetsp:Transcript_4605/g.9258  ORF Transcript_4605/g.9258 Transcript_4605/m.9258 type:complete len:196 (-) Transcript_4605:1327-1914(-)
MVRLLQSNRANTTLVDPEKGTVIRKGSGRKETLEVSLVQKMQAEGGASSSKTQKVPIEREWDEVVCDNATFKFHPIRSDDQFLDRLVVWEEKHRFFHMATGAFKNFRGMGKQPLFTLTEENEIDYKFVAPETPPGFHAMMGCLFRLGGLQMKTFFRRGEIPRALDEIVSGGVQNRADKTRALSGDCFDKVFTHGM